MASLTLERDVEVLIDNELTNLGWDRNPKSKNRNVFVQRAKTEAERRKLKGTHPDYALYRKGSDQAIAVIEAKRPGQKIHDALDQGARYAEALGAPIVFATDGIFTKTFHRIEHKPLVLNGDEVDELLRESLALRYLTTNEVSTLDKRVIKSRGELISIFETVNRILREEGLHQGLERFTEFANILFLKVLSEVESGKEEYGEKSKVNEAYRWESFRNLKGEPLLSYVNDTVLRSFAKAYHDENIFKPLQIKHPENLREIIGLLDGLQLTDINADIKGDAFEYFIRSYSASNPSDLGEIFTPRHIVKTAVKLLNPQIGETVYDPFCGTGGMLTVAFKHIASTMARTDRNWEALKHHTIYGADLTRTASIAKMNMILAGDGHNNIVRHDSLANPVDDAYDVVLTNMPFAQSTRHGELYAVPSKKADVICPQHCFRATKPGGRMAIIVPDGFLSTTTKVFQDARHYLLDHTSLKSVVSLPRGAFEPYNRAKASIMLFEDVKEAKSRGHYWYFDVKNDGFTLDKKRTKIEGANDLETVLSEANDLEEQPRDYLESLGIFPIEFKQVAANRYALNAAHYREPAGLVPEHPTLTFGELFEPAGRDKIGSEHQAPIMSITMHHGLIDQDEKFSKRVASKDISSYKKVYRGELVVGFPIDEGVLGFQLKYPFAAVSPAYKIWRLKRTDIDPRFLEAVIRSKQMREVYRAKMQGAVDRRRNVASEVFLGIRIPIPPLAVREAIVQRLEERDNAKWELANQATQIEAALASLWSSEKREESLALAPESVVLRFNELKSRWLREQKPTSKLRDVVLSMPYQQIIGMGRPVLPLLFAELRAAPRNWFWALEAITRENPIPDDANGDSEAILDAWLKWADEHGF